MTDDRQPFVPQDKLPTEERIENALREIERVKPTADLSARIIAALPNEAKHPNAALQPWLVVSMLLAAMIGFASAYQTAFTLRANGAFDLVSYYTAQPEIVTMYPSQAWGALAAAIPWMTVLLSLMMLVVAFVLTYRWTSGIRARASG